jgi:predicted heme/steroid binding protein
VCVPAQHNHTHTTILHTVHSLRLSILHNISSNAAAVSCDSYQHSDITLFNLLLYTQYIYFTHNTQVYDLTSFLSQHPGGVSTILVYAGRDASAVFAAIHADDAYSLKASYVIGRLAESGSDHKQHVAQRPRMPALTPDGKPIALSTRYVC